VWIHRSGADENISNHGAETENRHHYDTQQRTHVAITCVLVKFDDQSGPFGVAMTADSAKQIAGFSAEHGSKCDVNRSTTRFLAQEARATRGNVQVVTPNQFNLEVG
jgi:phosphoribosylformylglycinamidine (FGAM) synthase-like enzyme